MLPFRIKRGWSPLCLSSLPSRVYLLLLSKLRSSLFYLSETSGLRERLRGLGAGEFLSW